MLKLNQHFIPAVQLFVSAFCLSLWLYRPTANRTAYQKRVHYASLKTFSALPTDIMKQVINKKHLMENFTKIVS
jgi:hypothetical protein